MGLLGFVAAGAGLEIPNSMVGTTNAITIGTFLPAWASIVFAFMVFAGLVAILDSQFASVANMTGHDIYNKFKNDNSDEGAIKYARAGMIALVITALIVANLPGMSMVYLFLFFAILRAAVWLPSMIALLRPNWVSEAGMFWGIICAAVPGEALYIYGRLFDGGSTITFVGTLLAIFGAPVLTVIFSAKGNMQVAES